MRAAMPGSAQLIMPGCAIASSATTVRAQPPSQAREVLERFVDLMYHRRQVRAAFESCVVREGFIDHAGFGSRAAAMDSVAADLRPAEGRAEVLHLVCEGDIGMVHLAVPAHEDRPAGARVEIFRVAAGRIVEHWSVTA
jgi:predicted SnoaL-like aldol condensation-catalyzing enzyme